jgi:hypothetical protein
MNEEMKMNKVEPEMVVFLDNFREDISRLRDVVITVEERVSRIKNMPGQSSEVEKGGKEPECLMDDYNLWLKELRQVTDRLYSVSVHLGRIV